MTLAKERLILGALITALPIALYLFSIRPSLRRIEALDQRIARAHSGFPVQPFTPVNREERSFLEAPAAAWRSRIPVLAGDGARLDHVHRVVSDLNAAFKAGRVKVVGIQATWDPIEARFTLPAQLTREAAPAQSTGDAPELKVAGWVLVVEIGGGTGDLFKALALVPRVNSLLEPVGLRWGEPRADLKTLGGPSQYPDPAQRLSATLGSAMSFVERNQRWLLPVIGAGVAGVIWMNLPARSAPPAETLPPAPIAAPLDDAPQPALRAPDRPRVAGLETSPELQALEAPPAATYDPAPLLLAGRQALAPALLSPSPPPRLHPGQWRALCALPGPKSGLPAPEAAASPLPPLDFIISSGTGKEAWMGGVGYRPGSRVRGGYVLTRITATGVVLSGPSGPLQIPLKSNAAPPEPQKGKAVQP